LDLVWRGFRHREWGRRRVISGEKTMLTFCVWGERFCDGHWAAMNQGGHVRRLLERLAELRAQVR
jgi:hypothetical protein